MSKSNNYRIGIDVGGTNTDAVVMDGRAVVGYAKRATTGDVTGGVVDALSGALSETGLDPTTVGAVMIGTTHFVNAVVQRRHLNRVGVLRLCGPATHSLPPMVDWPPDLRDVVSGYIALLPGGVEYDGQPLVELDEAAVRAACAEIRALGLTSVAISSVFSPVTATHEERAAEIVAEELPGVAISVSHKVGRLGLLERENATVMNACLRDLGARTLAAFRQAMIDLGMKCPLYLAQNDGTLMTADFAEQFPVFTFASGPTNSMRGAAFLSGLQEAVVIDIGGTTTDIGALTHGFPREASVEVEVGGVRTNFRMPDVLSFGLGGGSLVLGDCPDVRVGPLSVGYEIRTKAHIFGGDTLTASDLAVAGGRADLGDAGRVRALDPELVQAGLAFMQRRVEESVDRMKLSRDDVPVVLVGGGSILVDDTNLKGASTVVRPPHYQVANAVGAAIAQISGEVDRVVALEGQTREQALALVKREAVERAVAAGADPESVKIVDVEDIPLVYLPSNAVRMRVKAVGDLHVR